MRRRLDPQSYISHVCRLLCTHLTWGIVCFLNMCFKLKKKRNKRREKKRMHCVARVSIKFKAIFRAHRFLLIVIIGGLQMRRCSFMGGLCMGNDCWWDDFGHGCCGEGWLFFAVKYDNKESSTVLKFNPSWVCPFLGIEKKGIRVAFSQITPTVRVCSFVCV